MFIIVICSTIENEKTGKLELVADYGVDDITGRRICLPWEHPRNLGAFYHTELNEWVIRDVGGNP